MKKSFLYVLFMSSLIFMLVGCSNNTQNTKIEETVLDSEESLDNNEVLIDTEENNETKREENMTKVEIKIKDYGIIRLELDPNEAPITVENFVKLANEKFYDGLTFHRIIPGFMIQGGDPEGTCMGGSKDNLKGEFSSNGVKNNISHKRGVISMARANDPNSASCQFFIMHEDGDFLDGKYAAFGKVIESIEVVDKICEDIGPKLLDDNGTVPDDLKPIIEYIKIIE